MMTNVGRSLCMGIDHECLAVRSDEAVLKSHMFTADCRLKRLQRIAALFTADCRFVSSYNGYVIWFHPIFDFDFVIYIPIAIPNMCFCIM